MWAFENVRESIESWLNQKAGRVFKFKYRFAGNDADWVTEITAPWNITTTRKPWPEDLYYFYKAIEKLDEVACRQALEDFDRMKLFD